MTGIIEVKGNPKTLKTMVIPNTQRSRASPTTNRMPEISSRTKCVDCAGLPAPGTGVRATATRHAPNRAALNRNTPDRLKACNTTPPSTGPAIRVALEVAESRLIAAARSPSERSPSRRRRTGMSVAQKMPLSTDAAAIQGKPSAASLDAIAITTDTASASTSEPTRSALRLIRSATTPTNGPHSASGSIHSIGTSETSNGESVIWNV